MMHGVQGCRECESCESVAVQQRRKEGEKQTRTARGFSEPGLVSRRMRRRAAVRRRRRWPSGLNWSESASGTPGTAAAEKGPRSYCAASKSLTSAVPGAACGAATATTLPVGSNAASAHGVPRAAGAVRGMWMRPWHALWRRSHRRTVASRLALTNVSAAGDMHSESTRSRWPRK